MRRHAVLFLLLAFVVVAPSAASAAQPWDEISGRPSPAQPGTPAEIRARDYAAFALERRAMRDDLTGVGPAVVTIPAPDGSLQRFSVTESPVLAPRAQRRFPGIRTYAATGLDEPGATARLDLTPLGFHASVQTADGMYYVDPRFKGDQSVYMSYYRSQLIDRRASLVEPEKVGSAGLASTPRRDPGQPVTRRTYRLAIANDPTYAAYFDDPAITGTDTEVQAAKATLVNRMNQIYKDDLAIVMELLDSSPVNFDTAAEFDAQYAGAEIGCTSSFNMRNDSVLDAAFVSNYDIGHFVGGGGQFDGGGSAGLGVVGGPNKGRGCTGLNPPVGDAFAVDYVAHELGHQFGGSHTFDGTGDANCSGNRSSASAVEPGSGSSVMAYAGICGADNLQTRSDPYFSQESVEDIVVYVTTSSNPTAGGFSQAVIANHSPIVSAPAGATIPPRTPFTLGGSATDPDNDALVFMWEQNDLGGAAGHPLHTSVKLDGPLFRQFSSPGPNVAKSTDNLRSFPDPAQVAADNTNAETGTCVNVECFSEFLPTAARTMNFRLTARDRHLHGGGVSSADTVVSVAGTTPFAVTGPAASQLNGASTATVTWEVAGTDGAPFNAPTVRISFSDDGGLTFPTEVAAGTPNDGSETVVVPNPATTAGRFKVEAIGNVFYDVTDAVPNPVATAPASLTPTATPSPTSTPEYMIPTATATAVATPTAPPTFPSVARLGPDLALVRRKLTPDDRGRIKLSLRCRQLTTGTPPATCTGRVRILDRRGRKLAARRFAFGTSQVGLVTLRLKPRVRAQLLERRLKVRIVAKVGSRQARKKVVLLPIR